MALINRVFGEVEYNYSRFGIGTSIIDVVDDLGYGLYEVESCFDALVFAELIETNEFGTFIPTQKGLDALTNGTLREILAHL